MVSLVHGTLRAKPEVPLRNIAAVVALSFCFAGSQINTFTIGPALPYIAPDLHAGIQQAWIPNAASLASACVIPCIGYIEDMNGRRICLSLGIAFNIAGIILFGTAQSFGQAVGAQALSGIGSVIQEMTAIAAIAELVPMRRRGSYLALPPLMTSFFAPAVLYANLLSVYANWRWLIWINLVWNGVAAILCATIYFPMRLAENRRVAPTAWKGFDLMGISLLVLGFTLVLVALNSGGLSHHWNSAYVLVQLIIGILIVVAFVLWEMSGPEAALVPSALFRGQRVVFLAFVIAFVAGIYYSISLNLGPTIVQEVFELSAVNDGLVALGPGLGLVVGSSAGSALLSFFRGRCREIMAVAAVTMLIFTAAQAALNPSSPTTFAVLSSFGGVGVGAALVPVSTWVTFACPQELIGTAVSLIIALRSLGGTIGYTIFSNIYQSQKMSKDSGIVLGPTSAAGISAMKLDGASAAKIVYLATIPVGAVALIAAVSVPDVGRYLSDRVMTTASETRDQDASRC